MKNVKPNPVKRKEWRVCGWLNIPFPANIKHLFMIRQNSLRKKRISGIPFSGILWE